MSESSEAARMQKEESTGVRKSLREAETENIELATGRADVQETIGAERSVLRGELLEREAEHNRTRRLEQRVSALATQLAATSSELVQKLVALEDLTRANIERENEVRQLRDELQRLNSSFSRPERLSSAVSGDQEKIREHYRRLANDYEDLARHYDELERRYKAILNSTSWRITLPCRQLVRRIKRLVSGAPVGSDWMPERVRRSEAIRLEMASVSQGAGKGGKTQNSALGSADNIARKLDNTSKETKKADRAEMRRQRKREERRLREVRTRLLNFGFVERGLAELERMASAENSLNQRRRAVKELMRWYLDRTSADDWRVALRYFEAVGLNGAKVEDARHLTILAAEANCRLGQYDAARRLLVQALSVEEHCDLYLAFANLEADPAAKAHYINRALYLQGFEEIHFELGQRCLYDGLRASDPTERVAVDQDCLVTVIVPVHNAAHSLPRTIDAILAQSWKKLELIIVDDASTDGTADIANHYAAKDKRIRVLALEINSGPYVARNVGLSEARGAFVTCNDSDDWSHPRKIEVQVQHLLVNPSVVANTSAQARAFEDMTFFRRGKPGYTQMNISSLMFRRTTVLEQIGYWDCVRFGGDSDYLKRMKAAFGEDAVVDLETVPLSFQRQTAGSLTASPEFGYNGYKAGARLEYERQVKRNIAAGNLRLPFPQVARPFPVPAPLRITRQVGPRHFDVIIASDFRLPGGSSASSAEEIKAQTAYGLKTGLVQIPIYEINTARTMNERVASLIDGERVEMIVYGEEVSCDLLIVRHPWTLQERTSLLPKIKARDVRVIVNQPPKRDYSESGETLYEIATCAARCAEYFGTSGVWHPIGPLVRDALVEYHSEELGDIVLHAEDWPNIISVTEWRRADYRRSGGRIRIGRHSRDAYVKWPDRPDILLAVYPDSAPYEVHVLGGADTPSSVLGRTPENWCVREFGSIDPKEFLHGIDVFVYYTHPSWVEAFGRAIIEAMAVGVPAILPHDYRKLFRDAAIYAEPDEVKSVINELMLDEERYFRQISRAWEFVECNFGYKLHASRIRPSISREIAV